jgi:hypothetical protein
MRMPFELPRDRMLTCILASSDVTTMLSLNKQVAKLLIQGFSFFRFQLVRVGVLEGGLRGQTICGTPP